MTSTLSSNFRISTVQYHSNSLGKPAVTSYLTIGDDSISKQGGARSKPYPTPAWGVAQQGINTFNEQLPCLGTTDQAGMVRQRVQSSNINTRYGTVNMKPSHIGQSKMTFNPRIQDGNHILRQPSNFNAMIPSPLGDNVSLSEHRYK